jgi:hypothetical protein
MSVTRYFETIKAQMPEGTERKVMEYLTQRGCIGKAHRATKEAIARAVLEKHNTTTDRQVRMAVKNLREGTIPTKDGSSLSIYPVPVLSNSGVAGYYLAATKEEIEEYRAETASRAAELRESIDASYEWKVPAQSWEELAAAKQLGLGL